MSCNGCRVLRKGCNENCILRQSLTAIDTAQAQAQAHATLFVAKFFGRAGLISFLSAVPDYQRPVLFQSLLFEACGRTVNPVNGAVGLLWTGNWHVCQSAVETVLRGGSIRAMPELFSVIPTPVTADSDDGSEAVNCSSDDMARLIPADLEVRLTRRSSGGDGGGSSDRWTEKMRTTTSPEVSETTTSESVFRSACSETKLLSLFL